MQLRFKEEADRRDVFRACAIGFDLTLERKNSLWQLSIRRGKKTALRTAFAERRLCLAAAANFIGARALIKKRLKAEACKPHLPPKAAAAPPRLSPAALERGSAAQLLLPAPKMPPPACAGAAAAAPPQAAAKHESAAAKTARRSPAAGLSAEEIRAVRGRNLLKLREAARARARRGFNL